MKKIGILTLCFTTIPFVQLKAQIEFNLDFGKRGPVITSDHYGVFLKNSAMPETVDFMPK